MSADLLIPLTALSGFDPSGLIVFDNVLKAWRMTLNSEGHELVWWNRDHRTLDRVQRDRASASTADAATRDRLARHIAGRVGLKVGPTAPDWGPNYAWEVYGWTLGDNHSPRSVMFMPPELIGWRPNWIQCSRRIPMAGLPNPTDRDWSDRLPDGVDRMFAEALGIVAVAVEDTDRSRSL